MCAVNTRRCSSQRENVEGVSQPPNDDVIRKLSRSLRQALGVSLFGIDVIINNQTGQHAVIDINAFPGGCCSPPPPPLTVSPAARETLSLWGHQKELFFVPSCLLRVRGRPRVLQRPPEPHHRCAPKPQPRPQWRAAQGAAVEHGTQRRALDR